MKQSNSNSGKKEILLGQLIAYSYLLLFFLVEKSAIGN